MDPPPGPKKYPGSTISEQGITSLFCFHLPIIFSRKRRLFKQPTNPSVTSLNKYKSKNSINEFMAYHFLSSVMYYFEVRSILPANCFVPLRFQGFQTKGFQGRILVVPQSTLFGLQLEALPLDYHQFWVHHSWNAITNLFDAHQKKCHRSNLLFNRNKISSIS